MITFPSLNANQYKIDRIKKYSAFRDFINQSSPQALNPASATYSYGPNLIIDRDNTAISKNATYFNSAGNITLIANYNDPRFEYDPVNVGTFKGLLIEDGRNNYILNANINGTHSLSSTATTISNLIPYTTYTLSFYTTLSRTVAASASVELVGTIVAGVPSSLPTSTATLTATASSRLFGNKFSYNFTLGNATSITIRVASGTIFYPQIENKSNSTSFIVTTGATAPVNRGSEKIYFGTAINTFVYTFYNQGPGSAFVEMDRVSSTLAGTAGLNFWTAGVLDKIQSTFYGARNSASTSFIYLQTPSANYSRPKILARVNSVDRIELTSQTDISSGVIRLASSYADIASRTSVYINGSLLVDPSPLDQGILPTDVVRIYVGCSASDMINGYLRKFAYWPFLLSGSELLKLSNNTSGI